MINTSSNNNNSDLTSAPSTSASSPIPPSSSASSSTTNSTSSIPSTKKKTTRRKFACVECRQQKSKCDAMEKAPDPCTKCFKKKIPCVLKRDFKRTYKRIRNEVIEKSFKHLTQYLSNTQFSSINSCNNSSDNSNNSTNNNNNINHNNTIYVKSLWDNNNFTKDKIKNKSDYWKDFINNSTTIQKQIRQEEINHNHNSNSNNISSSQLNLPLTLTEEDLKCTPKSLGDIYLTSNDISTLFNEFALHYHPFLPIVNLKRGPENIYSLSPCLFWVIMLTGLRRCNSILNKYKNINILKQLSHLVKSVLAEITISPIIRYIPNENDQPLLNVASVYSVQAFLIYTLWPPLTSSLSADTSWNTIGTAMFQALRVGLNSADFSKEYVTTNWDLINEQRKTWICCNIVSQFIASSMGFPPYVSFDHSVLTHQNNSNIPVLLQQMIQLSYFENQIIQTMNSNPLTPSGMIDLHERFSLLKVLNQQLSQLEFQLNQPHQKMDDIRKFLLYVAKVHLLTYYFTVSTKDHPDSGDIFSSTTTINIKNNNISTFQIKSGLVKVYNCAIDLLFHTRDMFLKDPDSIKYFPGCFILNIWQSACIVTKLIHSSISDIIDCKRGEEAYDVAIRLTLKASILKYDMAYRSSGIMRSIWSLFSNMYDEWQNDKKNADKQNDIEFNLNITVSSRMSVSVFFDCLYILKTKCGMAKLKRESGKLQHEEEEEDDDDDNIENIGDDLMNVSKSTIRKNVKDLKVNARKIIKSVPLDPNPINADNSSTISIAPDINNNTTSISTTVTAANSNTTKNDNNATSNIRSGSNPGSSMIERPPLLIDSLTNVYSNVSSPAIQAQKNNVQLLVNKQNGNDSSNIENDSMKNTHIMGLNTPVSQSTNQQMHENTSINPQIQLPTLPFDSESINSTSNLQQFPLERRWQENNLSEVVSLEEPIAHNINLNHVVTSLFDNNNNNRQNSNSNNTSVQTDVSPYSTIANFDNWDSEMVWKDVDILMNEFAFNPTV